TEAVIMANPEPSIEDAKSRSYNRLRELWPTAPLTSITFVADGKFGWAVGHHGTIIRTTDQGVTWRAVAQVTDENLNSIAFAQDGIVGCAVGNNGTVLWSRDRGETWHLVTSPRKDTNLETVLYEPSHERWWVVGEKTIISTIDGDHWQVIPVTHPY